MKITTRISLSVCACVLVNGSTLGQAQTNIETNQISNKPENQTEVAGDDAWLDKGALFSTLLGGFVSAFGGFAAVGFAHRLAARHKRSADDEFAKNVLRAIRFELESLSAMYREGIDSRLEGLKEGEMLHVRFALTEDWLTVFNQNAGHLGAIDGSLSKQIITVYSMVKGLIEEYRINNDLILELDRMAADWRQSIDDPQAQGRHRFLEQCAVQQAKKIKDLDQMLKGAYAKLLQAFDSKGIR